VRVAEGVELALAEGLAEAHQLHQLALVGAEFTEPGFDELDESARRSRRARKTPHSHLVAQRAVLDRA